MAWSHRTAILFQANGYKKNSYINEMIKISVTNNTIYSKNYLMFTIFEKFNFIVSFLKRSKIGNGFYYFLVNVIVFVDKSTFHVTESPFSNSKISLMIFGIDVDNVPPVDCTLVSYFNSIPPYILLIIFILLYLVILLYKF